MAKQNLSKQKGNFWDCDHHGRLPQVSGNPFVDKLIWHILPDILLQCLDN